MDEHAIQCNSVAQLCVFNSFWTAIEVQYMAQRIKNKWQYIIFWLHRQYLEYIGTVDRWFQ